MPPACWRIGTPPDIHAKPVNVLHVADLSRANMHVRYRNKFRMTPASSSPTQNRTTPVSKPCSYNRNSSR